MGRVEGKVALITGAARGLGRAHALRLAAEGASIIAIDVCAQLDTVPYPMATSDDLTETVKGVQELGQSAIAIEADVRDLAALEAAVAQGLAEFGQIDTVVANAGIGTFGPALELPEATWQEMIDVNLTGVWKTVRAAAPSMVERGQGGSIIIISSTAGLVGYPLVAHYNAAKHGLVGLMKALSVELAPHRIRVNTVHPSTVDTLMTDNPAFRALFTGRPDATKADAEGVLKSLNTLPVPWIEVEDVANGVLYLASDESRYVTGSQLVIDAGTVAPMKIPHA
jgi:SDR family mycofactocin-dependent oxidoreductase